MKKNLRNTALIGAYCCSTSFNDVSAFSLSQRKRPNTTLYRNSPGFVGFRDPDNTNRGNSNSNFRDNGYSFEEPSQYNNYGNPLDMRGQVAPRTSNLARRDSSSRSYSSSSVADDPQTFDYSSRYSQMPRNMMEPHPMQQSRGGFDGRIQGGSRQTFNDMGRGGQAFVETDGRPLNVEMEMWDGPNNTPSKVKFYSEDGRSRPMNINTNYNGYGGRGGTMSVRNVGSMEFPMRAGVGPAGGRGVGGRNDNMMGGYGSSSMGMNSPYDSTPIPSSARGITVQGGSLKTFKLPAHVNAAQVTIKSDGLPVNAKVELWGTSSHIKQVAEVYNDDGQTRPFAAIIDLPGDENTIAVRNTGPLEYPIQVVVEEPPSWDGPYGGMGRGGMYGGYEDERMMWEDDFGGLRGLPPPPPPMMGRPMLPPPPPF